MTLKNAYLRGNTIIYQRAVPSKLRSRYPGATIKHDLKTADLALFFDKLENQRQRHTAGDRETYESADFADYLPAIEVEALKVLKGKRLPTLSDALDLHLSLHKKSTNEKFVTCQRRAFGTLLAATGNKAIKSFTG